MKQTRQNFKYITLAPGLVLLILLNLLVAACGDNSSTNKSTEKSYQVSTVATTEQSSNQVAAVVNQQPAQTGGTIRIYSSLPLTGSSKDQSQTLVNAMQMALNDIAGPEKTIGGFKIDFVSLDDATAQQGQWDAEKEKANANRAAADPDAMIYLGTFNSGASKLSIPILNQAGIAMISPANTYPGLTHAVSGLTDKDEPDKYYPNKTRNFFRVAATDDLQGPKDAAYAIEKMGAKRFYVIDDSDVYGKGLAGAFVAEVKNRGLTVLNWEEIKGRESDYRDLARRIRSANPDFIFYGGNAQHQPGKLLKDIRASGVNAPFMGGDGINNPAFVKEAGVAGEGAISSISGVPPASLPAKGQDFLKRYQATYGQTTAYTINGYEVMAVALNAIKTAGKKDRAAILQAVAATKDFDGVLGKWSFDKNGDINLNSSNFFTFYIVNNGNLEVLVDK